MKKRLLLALAASACMGLASCQSPSIQPSSQAPTPSSQEPSVSSSTPGEESSITPSSSESVPLVPSSEESSEEVPSSESSEPALPSSEESSEESSQESQSSEEPSSSSEESSSEPFDERAPVYQGMSIAKANTQVNAPLRKQNGINTHRSSSDPRTHDDEIESGVEEISGIDIYESSETEYFVNPGELFIVEVHLSNPYDFEIQSFTLNGNKYSSYMFEKGSTMELLRLEVLAPEEPGLKEYTIDAIKYIDGTEIKDVRMSGEKTIKAGFTYQDAPAASVSHTISTTAMGFSVDITDPWARIISGTLHFYLTDGRSIILDQPIEVGHNEINASSLRMSTAYQYGIVAAYDLLDGDGLHSAWLIKETLYTKCAVAIEVDSVTDETLTFHSTIDDSYPIGDIIYTVVDESNGLVVKETTSPGTIDGLLSNHDYSVYVDYGYNLNSRYYSDWNKTSVVHTDSKIAPTFSFTSLSSNKTGVTYSLDSNDPSLIGQLDSVKVYDGETLVDTATLKEGEFTGLLSNHSYSIVAEYSYDLNDGQGVHKESVKSSFSTNPKIAPNVSINASVIGTSLSYSLLIDDPDNIASVDSLSVYRNGSESPFQSKEGGLSGTFENLWTNSSYIMVAKVAYDLNDGSDVQYAEATWQFNIEARYAPNLYLDYVAPSKDSVDYGIAITDSNQTLVSYSAELVSDGQVVSTIENQSQATFQNVLSNHHYSVHITYVYDLLDGEGQHTVDFSQETDTLAKSAPTVSLAGLVHEGDDINYSFAISDPDSTIDVKKVRLVSNEETVAESSDCEEGSFKNVTEDVEYSVVLEYSYDLNEGGEKVQESVLCEVPLNAFYYDEGGETLLGRDIFQKGSEPSFKGELPTKADDVEKKLQYSFGEWKAEETTPSRVKFVPIFDSCTLGLKITHEWETMFVSGYEGDSTEVTLPKRWNQIGVKEIGSSAFAYNDEIESVLIPEGYEKISIAAFEKCVSLTTVTIPETVTTIEFAAFRGCSALDGITLPSNLQNVAQELFNGCSSLTSIIIPDSATYIGPWAFGGCSSLAYASIGKGVTEIGYNAFGHCSALQSILLPASLKKVGSGIFFDMDPSFVIYAEAEKKGAGWDDEWNSDDYPVIWGAEKTESKTINGMNYALGSKGGEPAAFVLGVNEEMEAFDVPTTIEGAVVKAVYLKGLEDSIATLTSVSIPDGVELYGTLYFRNFSELETVTFGEGVKAMSPVLQSEAFCGCRSLTSISLPEGITELGWGCFNEDESLTEAHLPDSLKTIGSYAFCNCSKLTSVNIPEGVDKINDRSFEDCASLKSIAIPESVTSIGLYAFYRCSRLHELSLPSKLKTIGEYAFSETAIESLTLPGRLTTISDSAFARCYSLFSVTIENGVRSIPESMFNYCAALGQVSIPRSVVSIGKNAFYICPLEGVYIPSSVTKIGSYAFFRPRSVLCEAEEKPAGWADDWCDSEKIEWGVSSFEEVTQDGVRYVIIEQNGVKTATVTGAYNDVKDVVIASEINGITVTSIVDRAFQGNIDLENIVVAASITSVGDQAFSYCYSLKTITFLSTVPPSFGMNIFEESFANEESRIYVPAEALEAYTTALSSYSSRIEAIPEQSL